MARPARASSTRALSTKGHHARSTRLALAKNRPGAPEPEHASWSSFSRHLETRSIPEGKAHLGQSGSRTADDQLDRKHCSTRPLFPLKLPKELACGFIAKSGRWKVNSSQGRREMQRDLQVVDADNRKDLGYGNSAGVRLE